MADGADVTGPGRVGLLVPISHHFPPPGYGPWERVCHDLAEGLVDLGWDVTVFASAGSSTSARLWPTVPFPLAEADAADPRVWETLHVATAVAQAAEMDLDVLHSHLHIHALGYGPFLPMPLVTTLHGAAWNQAHHPMLTAFAGSPFVALSESEKRLLPELNYVATVHNGIRLDHFPPGPGGDRVAFVGRMAPEKAPDLAIASARRAGLPLVLAGGIEGQHREFFDERVRPVLGGGVDYVGELRREEVAELVGSSGALIMPLRWDEPFGLVVVESLAVGTPVVAWRRGAMGELVTDGVTGFLVDDVESASLALGKVGRLSRSRCRRETEARFSHRAMAEGYAGVYRRLMSSPPERR